MSKLLFFDLETTGLSSKKNGIHQLSGEIVIDGEVKESFDFRIKPFASDGIDKRALEVSGVTYEQLVKYNDPYETHGLFCQMLHKYVDKFNRNDKFHLVGYNNRSFDDQFLRSYFQKANDKFFGSWFWSDSIDVLVLASWKLRDKRHKLQNFKLPTVAKAFNIVVDESKLHDAGYDIYLTKQIYKRII